MGRGVDGPAMAESPLRFDWQWAMGNGQLAMGNGQWAVGSWQL